MITRWEWSFDKSLCHAARTSSSHSRTYEVTQLLGKRFRTLCLSCHHSLVLFHTGTGSHFGLHCVGQTDDWRLTSECSAPQGSCLIGIEVRADCEMHVQWLEHMELIKRSPRWLSREVDSLRCRDEEKKQHKKKTRQRKRETETSGRAYLRSAGKTKRLSATSCFVFRRGCSVPLWCKWRHHVWPDRTKKKICFLF